jgi:hypothetical protein
MQQTDVHSVLAGIIADVSCSSAAQEPSPEAALLNSLGKRRHCTVSCFQNGSKASTRFCAVCFSARPLPAQWHMAAHPQHKCLVYVLQLCVRVSA